MATRSFFVGLLFAATCMGCADSSRTTADSVAAGATATAGGVRDVAATIAELALFAPIAAAVPLTDNATRDAQIALGRALFYETLLSDGHDVSCNSCHALNGFGADGRPVSLGHDGRAGTRNAPTVYNAASHIAQFWDGRAKDLEEQAKGPILNPIEMGMPDSAAVLQHLRESPMYAALFRRAFPNDRTPIGYDNVGRAIGAFERGLVTPARWDQFLTGDSAVLSSDEQRGLRVFLATGCQGCHAGALLGGDRFMKAGLVNPWFSQADSGRYLITKDRNDLFVFKVPSLRNIAKTGPYFHDGSVTSLREAVRLMAHHQLGKALSAEDAASVATFLESLTGALPSRYIAYPQKPE